MQLLELIKFQHLSMPMILKLYIIQENISLLNLGMTRTILNQLMILN